MKRRFRNWRSERQSRSWLALLVRTFDDVAESRASAQPVPTPEALRAQLLRPPAAARLARGSLHRILGRTSPRTAARGTSGRTV
ncbi:MULTISPECIES: hypothetical protein [unclassified Bradyrhizobium]|uniref:hypothetical protein n=1 Tax=unclassified Bradyrhizobium TaxID=2631580 RepID=UPI002917097E|nr:MULTISPECIES: hypothetical protein [unclassified Bradyrhizobium]